MDLIIVAGVRKRNARYDSQSLIELYRTRKKDRSEEYYEAIRQILVDRGIAEPGLDLTPPPLIGTTAMVPERRLDSESGVSAIGVLKALAWINLVAGCVLALVSWFGEIAVLTPTIGLILLVEGIFGCAFLLVIACVAENVVGVRLVLEELLMESKSDRRTR